MFRGGSGRGRGGPRGGRGGRGRVARGGARGGSFRGGRGRGRGGGDGLEGPSTSEPLGKRATVIDYNKRIAALGAERKLAAALATFDELVLSRMSPTIVSYNVIIYACIRCGNLAKAQDLFRCLTEEEKHLKPTVVTYTTLLKGLCQAGLMTDASRLLDGMSRAGATPNLRTANMFLRGCLWYGRPDEAYSCYTRLKEWSLTPDRVAVDYTVRLLCSALRTKQALGLLEGAPSYTKGEPSGLVALATACALSGKVNRARRLLADAEEALRAAADDDGSSRLYVDRDSEAARSANVATFLKHQATELLLDCARVQTFIDGVSGDAAPAKRRRVAAAGAGVDAGGEEDEGDDGEEGEGDGSKRAVPGSWSITDLLPHMLRTAVLSPYTASTTVGSRGELVAALEGGLDTLGLGVLLRHRRAIDAGLRDTVSSALTKMLTKDSPPRLRWSRMFADDTRRPLMLEVCSGAGDWVLRQAQAHPEANWVATELRHHRCAALFSRTALERVPNLGLLVGDAGPILHHHIKPRSVSHVYVNFPEPPSARDDDSGDSESTTAGLLTPGFFRHVATVLPPSGMLTIVTDNAPYAKHLAGMVGAGGAFESCLPEGVPMLCDGVAKGFPDGHVPEGTGSGGGSYFDRLWVGRSKTTRFHLAYRRL